MMTLHPIGRVNRVSDSASVMINENLRPGLVGLDGFSHIVVTWWSEDAAAHSDHPVLVEDHPYPRGPDKLGVFATRNVLRPNSAATSVAKLVELDMDSGVIELSGLDAEHGSPVLDVKPYVPSLDRVAVPTVPQWCAHWPQSLEESAMFD